MLAIQEMPRQEQRIPMSYEAFLNFIDEDTHAEWVNGEVIIFMAATPAHQALIGFLLMLLGSFVEFFRLGKVFTAPLEMKVTSTANGREPDLLFVGQNNLWRITDKKLEGPADLVIEVISDESVARDRDEKFYEYQASGVREYWILDPRPGRQRADFWILDQRGRYRAVPPNGDDIYHSTVIPGFWLDVNWLWQTEFPNHLGLLAQIIGPEQLIAALQSMKPGA